MYLTDDLAAPKKFPIPGGVTIPAGGHLLFWADDEPLQGPRHAGFKLSAGGEQVGLFDTDARGNVTVDARSFGVQATDVSEGRCPDGGALWLPLATATPGAANGECGGGPAACCLPMGDCQDLDAGACQAAGGLLHGAGSSCATTVCPECIADDDCDDGLSCTLETCDPVARNCLRTPYDFVCSDGAFCNGAEWCDALAGCGSGSPPCDAAACNEASDVCTGSAAGSVPDRLPGQPLTLERSDGAVTLRWGPSCLPGDSDFAVYEGSIGDFGSHSARLCTTAGLLEDPGSGDRYYLVVPRNAASEGSYGRTSAGLERPPSPTACLAQSIGRCAP
jgi:hypothetical protein